MLVVFLEEKQKKRSDQVTPDNFCFLEK